jgi:hypothetical protein
MLKKKELSNSENGQLYASALLTLVLLARFMEDFKIVSQQLWWYCGEAVKLQGALMKPLPV